LHTPCSPSAVDASMDRALAIAAMWILGVTRLSLA